MSSTKRVNVGRAGETPREIIGRKTSRSDNPFASEKKKVNIGTDGYTPKKVVNGDGTTRAYNFNKRVNVGFDGETPKKTYEFYSGIPVAAAPNSVLSQNRIATKPISKISNQTTTHLSESNDSEEIYSPSSRPKTSRGKSHPSPDEFFDYIIPSPPPVTDGKSSRVIFVDSDEVLARNNSVELSGNLSTDDDEPVTPMDLVDGEDEVYEVIDSIDEYDNNDEGDGLRLESHNSSFSDLFAQIPAENTNTTSSNSVFSGLNSTPSSIGASHTNQRGRPRPNGDLDAQRSKQVRMLGCWLFGSALRI